MIKIITLFLLVGQGEGDATAVYHHYYKKDDCVSAAQDVNAVLDDDLFCIELDFVILDTKIKAEELEV